MIIGIPKEIKIHEYRVSLTPAGVTRLVDCGHQVIVQSHAGKAVGFSDLDYQASGAKIVASAQHVFDQAEMIIKVKEPQPVECALLKKGQLLFTYLIISS